MVLVVAALTISMNHGRRRKVKQVKQEEEKWHVNHQVSQKVFKQDFDVDQVIFDDFSLDVNKGDFITIIGSNGAGKSTLLNLIAGNLLADEGEILYQGKSIENLPNYQRSSFISYVHQDPSLGVAPNLTLLENLSMAWNKRTRNPLARGIRKKEIQFSRNNFKRVN